MSEQEPNGVTQGIHFSEEDLEPTVIPVTLGKRKFLLREASEAAKVKYQNCKTRATRFGSDGKPVAIDGMADAEPLLVSLCLFEVSWYPQQPDKERPVPLNDVMTWKPHIVETLYERVREISRIDVDERRQIAALKSRAKVEEDSQGSGRSDERLSARRGSAETGEEERSVPFGRSGSGTDTSA